LGWFDISVRKKNKANEIQADVKKPPKEIVLVFVWEVS